MEVAGLAIGVPALIQLIIRSARTIREAAGASDAANELTATLDGLRGVLAHIDTKDTGTMVFMKAPLDDLGITLDRLDKKLDGLQLTAKHKKRKLRAVLRWLWEKEEVEGYVRELDRRMMILVMAHQLAIM